ncbi:MAG: hypothetical protein HC767_01935, partial [Akkermansiaceae bacterium]|nr:hypothetical protein [Akkermansiaceae bacterium]
KLSFSRMYMQAAQVAESILGPYGQLWEGTPHAVADGHWAFQSLFARRYGIAGGTDQIQLNIIAKNVLRLPVIADESLKMLANAAIALGLLSAGAELQGRRRGSRSG